MSGRSRCLFRSKSRDERGAIAVEAALVLPLLVALLFGIVELSMLVKDQIAIASATRVGARMASAAAGGGPGTCPTGVTPLPVCVPANTPALAQAAADAIQNSGMSMPKNSIDYILVFKANSNGYPGTLTSMPTSCSGVTNCVKFTWYDSLGKFKYASGTWVSTTINACLNTSDMVGIYMHATHTWVSGLFGSSVGLDDSAVSRFEPLDSQTCAPGAHV